MTGYVGRHRKNGFGSNLIHIYIPEHQRDRPPCVSAMCSNKHDIGSETTQGIWTIETEEDFEKKPCKSCKKYLGFHLKAEEKKLKKTST